jgi:hypothetical protein
MCNRVTELWTTYRVEIDEAIAAGENVLILARDYARRELGAAEVEFKPAAIWTVRDGQITHEFYSDRAEALRAVGLAG